MSGDGDPLRYLPDDSAQVAEIPRLALRPREAARAIGVCERTLFTLTQRGEIPAVKLGRRVLYPTDQLRQWLAERSEGGER